MFAALQIGVARGPSKPEDLPSCQRLNGNGGRVSRWTPIHRQGERSP